MSDQTFATFVQRERDRLTAEREAIFNQQQELERKLAEINKEFAAVDAYEAAKTGKASKRMLIPSLATRHALPTLL